MRKKFFFGFFILLLVLLSVSFYSYGIDGEGEGGGQNQDEPLVLVTCNIQNNQPDVPADAVIQLEFSKNVVNLSVAENNKKRILLSDEKGSSVPIEIQMGDDQIDPTVKRKITIVPEKELEQGKSYQLTIESGFMAKSGARLPSPIIIPFQTEGAEIAVENSSLSKESEINSGDASAAPDDMAGVTDSGVSNMPESSKGEEEIDKADNLLLYFSVGCFSAAILLAAIYLYRRRK